LFSSLTNDSDSGCSFLLTNCLLVAVTNTAGYCGSNNASNSNPANVFQRVGAGAAYLLPGSQYRDIGTTNINSALLSDLKGRTTYGPTMFDSNALIDISTTWYPVAQRDTDQIDLGWHPFPADY